MTSAGGDLAARLASANPASAMTIETAPHEPVAAFVGRLAKQVSQPTIKGPMGRPPIVGSLMH
jgi:hypothetical protein